MIRYRISRGQLLRRIRQQKPKWLDAAEKATETLKAAGGYSKIGPEWSDVKPVYMRLQNYKCGFCERLLPAEKFGRAEHDVEHFRPKSQVREWPPAGSELNYGSPTGGDYPGGYYWLAYDPFNYLTACKTCNSNRKRDYFPIAASRGPEKADVRELLKEERPYLIYPLGSSDDDPERILAFHGIVPIARAVRGQRRQRALVTIDFFSLDLREELWRQRFAVIDRLLGHLEARETGDDASRDRARRRIAEMIADDAEHANCARSFLRVFDQDPRTAYDFYQESEGILREVRNLDSD